MKWSKSFILLLNCDPDSSRWARYDRTLTQTLQPACWALMTDISIIIKAAPRDLKHTALCSGCVWSCYPRCRSLSCSPTRAMQHRRRWLDHRPDERRYATWTNNADRSPPCVRGELLPKANNRVTPVFVDMNNPISSHFRANRRHGGHKMWIKAASHEEERISWPPSIVSLRIGDYTRRQTLAGRVLCTSLFQPRPTADVTCPPVRAELIFPPQHGTALTALTPAPGRKLPLYFQMNRPQKLHLCAL